MNPSKHFVNHAFTISILLAIVALQPQAATAQQAKPAADTAFSFAAYGDSRSMMYLPPKDGKPDLVKLFVEMFGLVLPEKIAEEVVEGCENDLRSGHQRTHQGHHALYEQDRSDDVDGRQRLGHRGLREDVNCFLACTERCFGSREANG
jgi:hypothetical protein